jgi:DNA-binding MarR family transcriptional regulator
MIHLVNSSYHEGNGRVEVADRLHSIAIHLLRRVRTADVEMGLTPERASLLSVLVFGGPRTASQLAAAEQVTPPAITRIVTALEEEGLARREPVAGDRRLVRVRATARGARVMRAGRRRRVEALSTLFAGVSDAELRTLDRAADILARALERPPAG